MVASTCPQNLLSPPAKVSDMGTKSAAKSYTTDIKRCTMLVSRCHISHQSPLAIFNTKALLRTIVCPCWNKQTFSVCGFILQPTFTWELKHDRSRSWDLVRAWCLWWGRFWNTAKCTVKTKTMISFWFVCIKKCHIRVKMFRRHVAGEKPWSVIAFISTVRMNGPSASSSNHSSHPHLSCQKCSFNTQVQLYGVKYLTRSCRDDSNLRVPNKPTTWHTDNLHSPHSLT